jgi:hypothetical protein
MLVASAVAAASVRQGWRARALATACVPLIGLMAALAVEPIDLVRPSISRWVVLGLAVMMAGILPELAIAWARSRRGDEIEVLYVLYAVGELALAAYAFRMSTGTWHNHAVQGALFVSVLAARAVATTVQQRPLPARAALSVALAALAVPVFALTDVRQVISSRRAEGLSIDQLLRRVGADPAAIFFVDRPGLNRIHGRVDLVYDPWLYPVFESIRLAEPRSEWLAHAIESGPVHAVVASSPSPRIGGVHRTLRELGYALQWRSDRWFVWLRSEAQGQERPAPG